MNRSPAGASVPPEIGRILAAMQREIDQLKTARTAQATSVSEGVFRVHSGASIEIDDGGDLTVRGGVLRMTDVTGSVGLLYFGPTGDVGPRIWAFSFDDGELAFSLNGTPGSTYWAGRDRQGNQLIANDSASGVGLSQPYLNIPMVPSSGTSVVVGGPFWPAFTNTSYQEVFHCTTTLWHPRISIGVGTNAPSGTVEWELRINGTTTVGSGSGTANGTFTIPGWGSTVKPDGAGHSVQLWARNTAGVQSRVIVDRCYGTKS